KLLYHFGFPIQSALSYTKCMCSPIPAIFYDSYSDVGTLGYQTAPPPKARKKLVFQTLSFVYTNRNRPGGL
ncbi:hypothetical protein, partial [Hungatella hathewayi]